MLFKLNDFLLIQIAKILNTNLMSVLIIQFKLYEKTTHKFQLFEHFLILTSTPYSAILNLYLNFNIRLVIC